MYDGRVRVRQISRDTYLGLVGLQLGLQGYSKASSTQKPNKAIPAPGNNSHNR